MSLGGIGIWAYAFDLNTEKVVATEIRAHDLLGSGVQGTVIQRECKFSYP
jgi:hypothetical protein